MDNINSQISAAVSELFGIQADPQLTVPDEQFGDFSSNIALRLAKQLGTNPRDIAQKIKLHVQNTNIVASAEVAGPGFINIFLNDASLVESISQNIPQLYAGKKYVVEYSCPNPFKELHAGHLYNTIAGDAIARLTEKCGAKVFRTNFGGDVGLHVGKAMFGIIETLGGLNPKKLSEIKPQNRAKFLSKAYVLGATTYEQSAELKKQIDNLNKEIYAIHKANDHQSDFAQIYWACREWSYQYFDTFYKSIEVDEFKYYPESATVEPGLRIVEKGLESGIFEKSDSAIIYVGETRGLHTRVFITGAGLPTYETKDLGVISLELADFNFDHRILLTGRDQLEYMKVVFSAATELMPSVAGNMTHITNGIIKFADGAKMSSRLGNVTTANDVLANVRNIVAKNNDEAAVDAIMLGAIKYGFLKQRLGGDIAFDPQESVSTQGNSGPYLQYAYARAKSIIEKSTKPSQQTTNKLTAHERALARALSHFQITLVKAATEYMPHHICTYLYDLAQVFNRFYENSKVVGDAREPLRRHLVEQYAETLKTGLEILGITAPNQM